MFERFRLARGLPYVEGNDSRDGRRTLSISRIVLTARREEIMKASVPSAVRWSLVWSAVFLLWAVFAVVPWMMSLASGSGQNADLYLVKTDSEGGILWSRTLGGPAWDYATAIQETQDGGYVLAGSTSSFGAGDQDILLVRMDAQGIVLWSATFGGPADERAEGLSIGPAGDILVFGTTHSYGAGSGDLYLVKADANGVEIWSRTYGGTEDEMAGSFERTRDGGFILVGTTRSFGSGKRDVYVVRTNSLGDRIWDKRHGSEDHDVAYGVKETTDGGCVIVGATQGTDSGTWDVYLIRLDAQGEALWHRTWGDGGYEVGYSVMEAADLGFFVSGYKDPFGSDKWDVYLIRTDEEGEILWSATYGGEGNDRADALQQAADGSLVIAGSTDGSGSGGWDMYLVRTDAEGNELWGRTYGGGDTDGAECVIQTRDGGLLMAGGTYSFGAEMVSLEPVDRTSPPTHGDRPLPPILSLARNGIGVTLMWTSSPLSAGYSLLYSPADGSYVGSLDVGTGTMLAVDLWPGAAFYVAVQAHDAAGATTLSNIQYLHVE
jgi:hypothetical protein